ncbi:AlbA family DNA-binding domain-containing protein [Lutimonas zeaxanthinifaciens]|uniref:AlbA family DNA-binding domain-containing protein n=1 Tax=Lutimonas zeaxanthinifaciens TaxID=3060215 RepID=UPI00265D5E8C|nr:ATP-binding protein [Lutimonas sp. YSD2104]WKK64692.1 ATP-binding protein [Lutimonas sp. YSD2104]
MRKYILSIVLILCGLTLVIISYTQKKNPIYTEESFAVEAQKFEDLFDRFNTQIKDHVIEVKNIYNDTLKVKDSLFTTNYFLDFLERNTSVNSVAFFQGNYKLVVRKENKSRIITLDSLNDFGIVQWNRVEDGKVISSWLESFDETIYNTDWFQDLIGSEDQLKWYLRKRSNLDTTDEEMEFFYAAYSYTLSGKVSAIVFEFSKNYLFNEFDLNSKKIKPRLTFKDIDGKELKLISGNLNELSAQDTLSSIDSLQLTIDRHFSNFRDIDRGNFNFNFKERFYWTSFKHLPKDSGIEYYLYTVPNSELISASSGPLSSYGGKIGLALVILGAMLLLIRKRFFYRPNRMKIPLVKDILKDEENRYLEFKSSLRYDYRQERTNPELEKVILKTIAAFGNTDGGILIIGVDDDKNIVGLEKDFQTLKKSDADYYEVHLRNIMHKLMGVKYVSKYIRTQFEKVDDGNWVCKIKVIPAKEPLFLKYKNKNGQLDEKFYVRSGNSSHEIETIAEINDYINSKFK